MHWQQQQWRWEGLCPPRAHLGAQHCPPQGALCADVGLGGHEAAPQLQISGALDCQRIVLPAGASQLHRPPHVGLRVSD